MNVKKCISIFTSVILSSTLFWSVNSFAISPDQTDNISQMLNGTNKILSTMDTPPEGFNPLTSSNEDLVKYGFPKRPKDAKCLKIWEDAMSKVKHYVKPIVTAVSLPIKQSNLLEESAITPNSFIWAGYYMKGIDNIINSYTPVYDEVYATWIQPSYNGTTANPTTWVGLGGVDGSGDLLQAGTTAGALNIDPKSPTHSSYGGRTGAGNNQFFIEDYPLGVQYNINNNITLNSGDEVYVNITYNNNPSSSVHYATIFFENKTTGQCQPVPIIVNYYDGSSADYITEAMNSNLDNWSTSFTGCCAHWNTPTDSGEGEFTGYNYKQKILVNSNRTPCGTPTPAVDGCFSVNVINTAN